MKIRLFGIVTAFVLVSMLALQTVSAAPSVPDDYVATEDVRLVWFSPLPGPDYFVRLESADGTTVYNLVTDDACFLDLFVKYDALNTFQSYYIAPNIGAGPDGADQRYVMDSIPRLIVNNRVGLD